MTKTAIILFNLGGPDRSEAVKPFLFNLFKDPAILRIPAPFRNILASLLASRREKAAQGIYAKIGGRSPILENTKAQALSLEQALSDLGQVKCFISMRYWHPFSGEIIKEVEQFAPDNLVMLPLYPQFSTTTTASSFKDFLLHLKKHDLNAKSICCYPEEEGFIHSLAKFTFTALGKASAHGKPRLLFSAHGLPEKIVRAGDPYAWQCERTMRAVIRELNMPGLDYVLCYQSRVGPLKWIAPSTDDEIRRAGKGKRPVIIVPIAFVSEHSETLVELDIEYRHLADKAGVPFFIRTPTVGKTEDFIEGLANLVRKALHGKQNCLSSSGGRICPMKFTGCINPQEKETHAL